MILGAGGQLAYDLQHVMADMDLVPLRHAELDICDYELVRRVLGELKPEVVINTAAFVRVDDCEDEMERAFQVNTFAVRHLAQVCSDLDCMLVHISSDYVFGGEKLAPYTEHDITLPKNVYGVSKLAGEMFVRAIAPRHIIVRSSGLYGISGSSGKDSNFVETMLSHAKNGKSIRVVNDQVLSPTFTLDLAIKIAELLELEVHGVFHITNGESCSWFDFATRIFLLQNIAANVSAISSDEFPGEAQRPAYSVLANDELKRQNLEVLRPWHEALQEYLEARSESKPYLVDASQAKE